MKLEKVLSYLEAQLPCASPETDAYLSWTRDTAKGQADWSLWERYLWFCKTGYFSVNENLKGFLDALEEVNNHLAEMEQGRVERIEDYDVRTYH